MKRAFRSITSLGAIVIRMYFREPVTVFLSVGLLVLMMVMIGFIGGASDAANLRLPVAVLDRTQGHSPIASTLENDHVLTVRHVYSESELAQMIRSAQAIAGVVLGTADPNRLEQEKLVIGDGVQNHWSEVGVEHLRLLLSGQQATVGSIPTETLHVQMINNRLIDFIFPGVLALSILQTALGSASFLLSAKKMGVLRRLQLTPLNSVQLVSGFIFGRCGIVLFQLAVLFAVAKACFHVHVLASWSTVLAEVALGVICFMSLSSAVAMLAPSVEAGVITTQLLNFPMAFLCGVFFPNGNLPGIASFFARILPLTYYVNLLRGTMQGGEPLSKLTTDIAVLAGWTAVFMLLCIWAGNRQTTESI